MTSLRPLLLAAVLLVSCGPKKPVEPAVPATPPAPAAPVGIARPAPVPDALPAPEFHLPKYETRTLSNGLTVLVATRNDIPMWDARLVFDTGAWSDPKDEAGLAAATMDMLNEGAAGLSAEDISRQLKKLGSSIGTYADDDSAGVTASGLVRNLEPTIDLWAKVITQPDFPEADWKILQRQYVADVTAAKENPTAIAQRAYLRVWYGPTYRGNLATEKSLGKIKIADMKKWRDAHLGPQNAILLVGGAVTADEVVPVLEAKLGKWTSKAPKATKPAPTLQKQKPGVIYLVDKPGAAQSVIRVSSIAGSRMDPDYYALQIGVDAIGQFTGRINSNLREKMGVTYGASCTTGYRYGTGLLACSTSVVTDRTGDSLKAIQDELAALAGPRPLTPDEVSYFKKSETLGFPSEFQLVDAVLSAEGDIWRYDLPPDWIERFIPGVDAVDPTQANTALTSRLKPEDLVWVVVGDEKTIRPDIEKLGFKVQKLDRDGNPLGG